MLDATNDQQTEWVADRFNALVANVEAIIRGKHEAIRNSALCLLSGGHLLVEDPPGTGKTVLAKAFARSIGGTSSRIQFTPDLLPSDVTGVSIWDAVKKEFVFHPGGVFANIVHADEINRASPKTQSALLECMEERQVTVDAVSYVVPEPFLVIATQNPVEQAGTYPLPEAQVDRFTAKLSLGYASVATEVEILGNLLQGQVVEDVQPVLSTDEFTRMQAAARRIYVAPALLHYIAALVGSTRTMTEVSLPASTRGSRDLMRMAQAYAASKARSFVTADDVKELAHMVLAHRMRLRPEAELQGVEARSLIDMTLASLPVPRAAGV